MNPKESQWGWQGGKYQAGRVMMGEVLGMSLSMSVPIDVPWEGWEADRGSRAEWENLHLFQIGPVAEESTA